VKVLYVLGDVPARGTGGYTRLASVVSALARSHAVEVAWPDRAELVADSALGESARLTPVTGRGHAERLASAAVELLRGHPVAIAQAVKPGLVRAVRDRVAGGHAELVVADQLAAAVTCMRAGVPGAARCVYNANNVEWSLRARGGLRQRLRWAGTRRLERRVLAQFDQAWMVSERDRAAVRELCPRADVRVVPNAVDLSAIRPVERPGTDPVVLFVGSFDYEPNRRGLEWLATEVMPVVWRARPDARLRAVGRWPGKPWRPDDERVELAGFVADIHAAYAAARCCVAPLAESGGTPLKVVEALAVGLPLVATSTAVRALDALEPGRDVLVADGREAFAAALLDVLDSGYEHGARGAAARAAVERNYSVDAIAGVLDRALSS
jgi:polysaccharide biosynthesis protein PslH